MRRCLLLVMPILIVTGTFTAEAQQTIPPIAQSAPPTQTPPAGTDLASTMKALEDQLRTRGRLAWTWKSYEAERETSWDELISVIADPNNCSLRLVRENEHGTIGRSYYLDEISDVQVLSTEDSIDRISYRNRPGRADVQPAVWSVVVEAWEPFSIYFPSEEAADEAASRLSESVNLCSAVAITPRGSIGPGLTETLGFIKDKLISQGHVESTATVAFDDRAPFVLPSPVDYLDADISSAVCRARIRAKSNEFAPISEVGDLKLSFQHISKIEVLKYADYMKPFVVPPLRMTTASPTFVLQISSAGGETKLLFFSDETLANRVAKAINHAAELCGAGAEREPF